MHLNIFKKKDALKQEKLSLREKKHQANLQKNSGLYFQIGLIVSLFVVFGLFQLRFDVRKAEIPKSIVDDEPIAMVAPVNYVVEKTKVIQQKLDPVIKTKPKLLTNIKQIDNDEKKIIESVLDIKPTKVDKAPAISDIDALEESSDIDTMPVSLVQELPLFPGCEKFSDKKKQFECMSKKIAKHINRKFDPEVASDNGLSGVQKIMVAFTIDTKGEVVDIKARSPHPVLQKEAIKAVASLPKMKPAKQGFKKVNVTYALPISFRVND